MTLTGSSFFSDEEDINFVPSEVEPMDDLGRYLLPNLQGKIAPHTRVTTISDSLGNPYGIERHFTDCVVHGLIARPDLYHALQAAKDDEKTYKDLIQQASVIGGVTESSNLGTALHSCIERWLKGEDIADLPEFFQPDIRAFRDRLAAENIIIKPELVERVVRHSIYGIAGRVDIIGYMPDDDIYVIIDAKRKKDPTKYPHATATQVATYAACDCMYDYKKLKYEPLPRIRQDFALVAWFEPGTGTCQLLQVDLPKGQWALQLAMGKKDWFAMKHLIHPYIGPGSWRPKPKGAEVETTKLNEVLDEVFTEEEQEQVEPDLPTVATHKPGKPPKRVATKLAEDVTESRLAELLRVPHGAVDPEAEAAELATGQKPELVALIQALGSNDVQHHRRELAKILVDLLNEARRGSKYQATSTIDPEPDFLADDDDYDEEDEADALGMSEDEALELIQDAASKEDLKEVWKAYTDIHGEHAWKGQLLLASTRKFGEIKAKAKAQQRAKASNPLD